MAAKKITVWSDDGDESLTPEEEQKIEDKVDAMLDIDAPKPAAEPIQVKLTKPEKRSASKILVIDSSSDEQSIVPLPGAPDLPIKKAKSTKKLATPKATVVEEPPVVDTPEQLPEEIELKKGVGDESPDLELDTTIDQLVPAELPNDAVHVDINDSDLSANEPEQPASVEAVEIQDADTTPAEVSDEESSPESKKYRPPDGPMPFKRRDPEVIEELLGLSETADQNDIARASAEVDAALADVSEKHRTPRVKFKRPRRKAPVGRKKITGAFLIIIAILAAILLVPFTRVMALNMLGVRSSLELTLTDGATGQSLSGAEARVGSQTVTSDSSGHVTIENVRLGNQTVQITKNAYAAQTASVDVQWRKVGQQLVNMTATGPRYQLTVNGFVSGKPISGVRVTVGSSQATSDSNGRVSLVLAAADTNQPIRFAAAGYRTEKTTLADITKDPTVQLVPSAEYVFIARQAAVYNVYAKAADAATARLVLAGSGLETAQMDLLPDDTTQRFALVSTRDNQKDKAGYLLDTLSITSLSGGPADTIDHGESIKLISWSGNRLLYSVMKADAATNDSTRYTLYSYDATAKRRTEIDHTNSLNDALFANGTLYYAVSDHFSGGSAEFKSVKADGSDKQELLAADINAINRVDYDTLSLAASTSWYSYRVGSTTKPVANSSSQNNESRLYVTNPFATNVSAWIDNKASTVMIRGQNGKDTALADATSATYPLHWLSADSFVYRTTAGGVSSDYVVSTAGGQALKIADVADVSGLALWHD